MPRNTDDPNGKKSQSFKEFSAQRRQARSATVDDARRQRREQREQEEREKQEVKARREAAAERRESAARERAAASAEKKVVTAQKREAAAQQRRQETRPSGMKGRLLNQRANMDAREKSEIREERIRRNPSPYRGSAQKASETETRRKRLYLIGASAAAMAVLIIFVFGASRIGYILNQKKQAVTHTSAAVSQEGNKAETKTETAKPAVGKPGGSAAKSALSMSTSQQGSAAAATPAPDQAQSGAARSYSKDTPTTIKLTCFGDNTLGTDENFDYSTNLNTYYEMYGADYFLENVRDIFEADDLTITNFEGTLTYSEDREDKLFAFKGDPEFAHILSDSSVETCNTANNHSHDYGEQSYTDTLKNLKAVGIVPFGYDEVAFIDVKGIKVGLLGIYELDDHLAREPQLRANMQKLKDGGADLIVAVFHWGNELEYEPDSNERYLGHLAVDLGADLVWGSHSHCLQGIETYKGVQILYSLANFCFGGNTHPTDMDTMIFQQEFTVSKDGVTRGETTIIPACVSSDWDYNDYRPTPMEGEEYDRIMNKIEELSALI